MPGNVQGFSVKCREFRMGFRSLGYIFDRGDISGFIYDSFGLIPKKSSKNIVNAVFRALQNFLEIPMGFSVKSNPGRPIKIPEIFKP
jgi:hypothetical protein